MRFSGELATRIRRVGPVCPRAKMKSLLCGLVLVLAVATASVKAQTGNYILQSYNAAVVIKDLYEVQLNHYREVLTGEAWDMGRVFTDQMADWIAAAQTDAQGAALRTCANQATVQCEEYIDLFNDRLQELQHDTDAIHLSVYSQLTEWNIKSEEYSLFYYYHTQRMDERLEYLSEHHVPRLQEAYNMIYDRWFDVYYFLRDCAADALATK